MRRATPIALSVLLMTAHVCQGDETQIGNCTIVNTDEHPIVIGLYMPTTNGISEKLISVPSRTELYDVPIPLTDDAQIVIAYSATMEGDKVRRTNPIQILGHRPLRFLKNNQRQVTRDAMIVYRGGSDSSFRYDDNSALWLPGWDIEAQDELRRANEKSKIVPTPLTRTEFVDVPDSQQVVPRDARERK